MQIYTPLDIQTLLQLQENVKNCVKCQGSDLNCDCVRMYKYYNALVLSAIPLKYRAAELNQIKVKSLQESVAMVQDYIVKLPSYKDLGTSLYLYGNTGTGKTFIGVCVLKAAVGCGYTAFFCTVEQYKSAIFNKDVDFLYYAHENDFVMIDDYGREYVDSKGFIDSQIDEFLRYRYDHSKCTILTSNIPLNQLSNLRIKSIISEVYKPLLFSCPDYRKRSTK